MKSIRFSPPTSYDLEEYERRQEERFRKELDEEIRQKKVDRLRNALEKSGLVNAVKTKRFDNFIVKEPWQERMKSICEKYAENPEGWLFVSGISGCGKTHLCTAVAGKLIEKEIPVWYMLYRDEVDKMKPNSWTDPEERDRLIYLYKNVDVLYIDDLFQGGATRTDADVVYQIINHRYIENKPTIISTELTLTEISDIRTAIAGRISEMSTKVLIKNDKSRNYRMKAGA